MENGRGCDRESCHFSECCTSIFIKRETEASSLHHRADINFNAPFLEPLTEKFTPNLTNSSRSFATQQSSGVRLSSYSTRETETWRCSYNAYADDDRRVNCAIASINYNACAKNSRIIT